MRIEEEIKLDFKDVLIRPKRSTLASRQEVDVTRQYRFRWSDHDFDGVPVIAANMDGVGTLAMARTFQEMEQGMTVALHKHYPINDLLDFYEKTAVGISGILSACRKKTKKNWMNFSPRVCIKAAGVLIKYVLMWPTAIQALCRFYQTCA